MPLPRRFLSSAVISMAVLVCAACGSPNSTDRSADDRFIPRSPLPRNARIIFFGDSITEAGVGPGGYVSLVESSLQDRFPNRRIRVSAAGVSGDRVPDLERRVERDVVAKTPTHVVIYIGVNDVGRGSPPGRGNIDRAVYRRGLVNLVSRLRDAGSKVILCTPAVIGEDVSAATNENRLLDEYSQISREVAAQERAGLCDLRAAFVDYLRRYNQDRRDQGVLTSDGVHLNQEGNRFVARQLIRALNGVARAT